MVEAFLSGVVRVGAYPELPEALVVGTDVDVGGEDFTGFIGSHDIPFTVFSSKLMSAGRGIVVGIAANAASR